MRRLIPSRKTREKFYLTYELKGAQRAVNLLTKYYEMRSRKIVVDGRRVGNGDEACYDNNVAYFTRKGLNKRNVLHELYHHLAYVNDWDMDERTEERGADAYVRRIMKGHYP